MTRILLAGAAVLMLTGSSLAQSYCAQVQQAVATYGYEAAKRHAVEHYSKEEVAAADRCLGKHEAAKPQKGRHQARVQHPKRHHART